MNKSEGQMERQSQARLEEIMNNFPQLIKIKRVVDLQRSYAKSPTHLEIHFCKNLPLSLL